MSVRDECGQSEGSDHDEQGWGKSPDGEGETEGVPRGTLVRRRVSLVAHG